MTVHRELTWADLIRESREDGWRDRQAGRRFRPPLRDGRCEAYWQGWAAAAANGRRGRGVQLALDVAAAGG